MRYDWTRNNVRELRNVVERMIIATDGEAIGVDDIPADIREGAGSQGTSAGSAPTTFHALRAEAERQIIVAALEHNDWHITRTAQALGLADHAGLPAAPSRGSQPRTHRITRRSGPLHCSSLAASYSGSSPFHPAIASAG